MAKRFEDYKISGLSGETICRDPDSIRGTSFTIENLNECTVYVMDHSSQMTVDNVNKSFLFIGPVQGSFFLRDCYDSVICVACRQFRTKNVARCKIFLYCSSRPAIEYSKEILLAPYNFAYPHQDQHFKSANLNPGVNDWVNVHDFNADGEVHWRELPPEEYFIENKELLAYTTPINPVPIPAKYAGVKGVRPSLMAVQVVTEESKTVNKRPMFSISAAIGGIKTNDEIAKVTIAAAETINATVPPFGSARTGEYRPFAMYEADQSFNASSSAQFSSQQSKGSAIEAKPPQTFLSASPQVQLTAPNAPQTQPSPQPASQAPPPFYSASFTPPPFQASPRQPQPVQSSQYQATSEVKLSIPPPPSTMETGPAISKDYKLSVPSGNSPNKSYNEEASGLSVISLYKPESAPLQGKEGDEVSEFIFEFQRGRGYVRPKYTPHYVNLDLLDGPLHELSSEAEKAQERLLMLEYTFCLIFIALMLHILLAVVLRLIEDWFIPAWGLFLLVYIAGAIVCGVIVIIKWLRLRKASNLKLQELAENVDLKRRELKFYADLASFRIVTSLQP
mmetsp:Transcript_32537/g.56262  ORF Transcript_32537/g.56262 Transcript_32537/m.56262 type:complete len:563 (+) Transcript_32537:222-1910(+)